eukprot:jgi/Hompol1/6479/HPOL_002677-RA
MVSEPQSILGYELGDVVGEGGQAKVRLAFNTATRSLAAVKIIKKHTQAGEPVNLQNLRKEVKIHEAVSHENIIQLFKTGEDEAHVYLVMEYAASGELFDLIEPDIGIDEDLAHLYFQQLIAGVEYLHDRGVSHRDLKPEISDFGLATVFKHKGATRILTTPCGTPPYVAPEIHNLKYDGAMVDIWSSGIILYVLLAGNTPWAEPTFHDEEFRLYAQWFDRGLDYHPWTSFSPMVLELLRGIMRIDPQHRFTISHIRANQWFLKPNPMLTDGRCNDPAALAKRLREKLGIVDTDMATSSPAVAAFAFSQPNDMRVAGYSPE